MRAALSVLYMVLLIAALWDQPGWTAILVVLRFFMFVRDRHVLHVQIQRCKDIQRDTLRVQMRVDQLLARVKDARRKS